MHPKGCLGLGQPPATADAGVATDANAADAADAVAAAADAGDDDAAAAVPTMLTLPLLLLLPPLLLLLLPLRRWPAIQARLCSAGGFKRKSGVPTCR